MRGGQVFARRDVDSWASHDGTLSKLQTDHDFGKGFATANRLGVAICDTHRHRHHIKASKRVKLSRLHHE